MKRVLTAIEKVLVWFSVWSVFCMVCLTTADAAGRYLLNMPIPWAYEVTEKYLMVVSVFFALSYGYHYGSNIRVTFVVRHFGPRTKLIVDYIVQVLAIAYGLLMVVGTFLKAMKSISERMQDTFNFPLGPAYLVLPAGLLLLTLWLLYDLPKVRKGQSHLLKEEEDSTTPVA
ncbi:MAG TPA: TRAP transporter small permease [Syntrophorhabdaceae bacterium]|nr:TRAP transporter small permease [Syntrophorhabdaceae bacterium]HQM80228.1 TRAP transporter small permease [Syntrophorhabdaceae bacterium]